MAVAEIVFGAAGGSFQQGEDADLRQALRFLDEAEFYTQFGVAITVMPGAGGRCVVGQRRNHMKLYVGDHSVVQFHVGRGAGPIAADLVVLGSDVKFPVLALHGFRIIGDEGRAAGGVSDEGQAEDCQPSYNG